MSVSIATISVLEVAEQLNLIEERVNGKAEWHGANPFGGDLNAKSDGFILYPEGNAWDRKSNIKYTCREVAEMANIDPAIYYPIHVYNSKKNITTYTPLNGHGAVIIEDESSPAKPKKKVEKKFDRRSISDRGVRDSTLEIFHISVDDDRYSYPTCHLDGAIGRRREKFFDPVEAGKMYSKTKKPIKYRWAPYDKNPQPCAYNLDALDGEDSCWIVGGEVDIWIMTQTGFVAIAGFGETRLIGNIVAAAKKAGVKRMDIALDDDEAGNRGSIMFLDECRAVGMECYIRSLRYFHVKDIADLYEKCGFRDQDFSDLVNALEVVPKDQLSIWRGYQEEKRPEAEIKPDPEGDKSSLSLLMQMIGKCDAFYTPENQTYIIMKGADGIERSHLLHDSKFYARLSYLFFQRYHKTFSDDDFKKARLHIEGRAMETHQLREVAMRSAEKDGSIYIDLNTQQNHVVRIHPSLPDGWEVTQDCPVHFRRASGMESLPIPLHGGSPELLRELVNVNSEEDWIMMLSWLAYSLMPPTGDPYPVLAIHGEMGSAKSTTCRILRKIIDPNYTTLIGRSVRNERELAIIAKNCHVLGFDNVSDLPRWLSESLCQLVTEGCFRTRKLQTDDEEILFRAKRPIIINGIDSVMGREDFQTRQILCKLGAISEQSRLDEAEIWVRFHAIWPAILGFICTAISHSMTHYEGVRMDRKPRMAGFARRVMAMEGITPFSGQQFLDAYLHNQSRSQEMSLESDPVANEIMRMMEQAQRMEFTQIDLYHYLRQNGREENLLDPEFPKSPRALTNSINRMAPNLRAMGIDVMIYDMSGKKFIKFQVKKSDPNL